jgi:alpha-tubulin suppressor-like RCC1 family protein
VERLKTIEPALVGGYAHGHALTYDGKLYAWGINTLGTGELGVGDASNKTVPTLCTGITQGQVEKFLDTDGNAPKTMTWIKNDR